MRVREASPKELGGWDALVSQFPHWRLVQQRAWLQSLEAAGCGRPLYLVFEKAGRVVGVLPGLLVQLGPLRLYGSPLPGWQTVSMGPAFDERLVSTHELMSALVPLLETRYGVHHIELATTALEHEPMARLGFHGEPMYTCRAPLYPHDEARTLKTLKDSARRNIKRAERLGLVVRLEHDEAFVGEHFDQLREVYVRGGHTAPFNRQRVLACFRHLQAAGNLLAISVSLPDGGPVIATGMFLMGGRELLLWMWAHRTRYRWYRPTELMTWTAIRHALAAGCESFDLMGRGDFKLKFGAQLDGSKFRWVRSRSRWLRYARDWAQKAHLVQQALRGRLARLWWPTAGAQGNGNDDGRHREPVEREP